MRFFVLFKRVLSEEIFLKQIGRKSQPFIDFSFNLPLYGKFQLVMHVREMKIKWSLKYDFVTNKTLKASCGRGCW
jgi:hypothetical protein